MKIAERPYTSVKNSTEKLLKVDLVSIKEVKKANTGLAKPIFEVTSRGFLIAMSDKLFWDELKHTIPTYSNNLFLIFNNWDNFTRRRRKNIIALLKNESQKLLTNPEYISLSESELKTIITEKVLMHSFLPYLEHFQELPDEDLNFNDFTKDKELENYFNNWLDEWEHKVEYQKKIIQKYRTRWNAARSLSAKFKVNHPEDNNSKLS